MKNITRRALWIVGVALIALAIAGNWDRIKAAGTDVNQLLFIARALPTGTIINLRQMGTGQVTVVGLTGVTVLSPNGLKTRTQYSTISLVHSHTLDTWVVGGDSTP